MTEFPPAHKEVRVILGYASSKCYTSFALYKLLSCIRTQRNCIAAHLRLRMLWGVILSFRGVDPIQKLIRVLVVLSGC